MLIFLSAGHSLLKNGEYTSAQGYLNEYKENVYQVKKIATYLRSAGHQVDTIICPERVFNHPREESKYKLPKERSKHYDLAIEIHFNCFNKVAHGTECLSYSSKGEAIGIRISRNLENLFANRGQKNRKDLYMLRDTRATALIVEVCFCDNKNDAKVYNSNKDKVALAIAEGINNGPIKTSGSNNTSAGTHKIANGDYKGRKAKVVRVKSNDVLNIRYDRSAGSKDIGDLKPGTIVTCQYCLNGWMSIEGFKGNKGLGYVNSYYLEWI